MPASETMVSVLACLNPLTEKTCSEALIILSCFSLFRSKNFSFILIPQLFTRLEVIRPTQGYSHSSKLFARLKVIHTFAWPEVIRIARSYSHDPRLFTHSHSPRLFSRSEVIRPIQCINALSNTVNISQFFAYIQPLHLVSQILYLWPIIFI